MAKVEEKKDIWTKLETIDQRIWYWILIVVLAAPLIRPLMLPITITEETLAAYNVMDAIPPDGVVMVFIGAGAGMWPEVMPAMVAVMHHMYSMNTKFVLLAGAMATDYKLTVEKMFSETGWPEEHGYKYGEDWAYFGFFAGGESGFVGLVEDFRKVYKVDEYGADIEGLAIMKNINTATDWEVIWSYTSGLDWIWPIRHTSIPYGVPVLISVVAPGIPEVIPWLLSGDIAGFLGSTKGAAEYEQLIKTPGSASKNLDAINLGHILLMATVVLGNVAFFVRRSRGEA